MKTQKQATKIQVVALKKMPKPEALAPQAFAILETLKAAKGTMTTSTLKAEMPKRVKTKQATARIWNYYRDALVKSGFISLKGAKK
jgi:hypothetical protein